MPDRLTESLETLARRLVELARSDPELRAELRALAEAVLDATGDPLHPAELTLGRSPAPSSGRPSITLALSGPEPPEESLDALEARCLAKAESARTWATRQRGFGAGLGLTEDDPSDEADQAAHHEAAAGGYQAVAESLALVRSLPAGKGDAFDRALHLLVEAQSSLRKALHAFHRPDDPDQIAAFECARDLAARHQIYVRRYMRADDQPDPAAWPDLLARIRSEASALSAKGRSTGRLDPLDEPLRRIGLHQAEPGDWPAVVRIVDELVRDGLPPSSRELRDRLLPVVDDLPEASDWPAGFRHVLREVDRYLANRPAKVEHQPPAPSPEVRAAERLLRGKSIVLIGGARRREAQQALERALGLKGLIWIETKEHQSISTFEPIVARPEVALVLLAIRWSSHAFGDVRVFCDRHGKPLVRLPGGYNPNQVAAQVVAQCGDLLSRA